MRALLGATTCCVRDKVVCYHPILRLITSSALATPLRVDLSRTPIEPGVKTAVRHKCEYQEKDPWVVVVGRVSGRYKC